MLMLEEQSGMSLFEQIRFKTYETFYQNVINRLCLHEEVINYNFLHQQHANNAWFYNLHSTRPTLYRFRQMAMFTGMDMLEICFFVIGMQGKIIVLVEPNQALQYNLPMASVLETGGHYFEPYYGCHTTFWQTELEPTQLWLKPPHMGNSFIPRACNNDFLQ